MKRLSESSLPFYLLTAPLLVEHLGSTPDPAERALFLALELDTA